MPATGRKPRLKDGLTVKQAAFCKYLAQGNTKTDSYIKAFGRGRNSNEAIWQRAHKLSKQPKVMSRLDELLSAAKVEDMLQVGQVMRMLMDGLEMAAADRNWSAYSALMDRAMRHKALLSDRLVLNAESQLTDTQLIDALAGADPDMKQRLTTLLHGRDGFDA